jgi:capsular polysaccharide biosynthesis protein
MDLRAYLSILRRRGWIILVTAILAMVLAGGLSLLQTKTYRATARISAVPARPDWGLGSSAKDLLRSFVLNINTHDMANQVITAASLDMSSYDLLSKLPVSAEPENFAIRIDAVDEDPQVAAKMVLTMAQLYVNERTSYYNTLDKDNRIEVKLVDSVIDAPLFRPNIKMNLVAGFALGAVIGALIVLLLEWMSADILATPVHVQRATGLAILGAIPVQRKRSPSLSESRAGSVPVARTKESV